MTKLFKNEKETDRAIKAAVDQAKKVKWTMHCIICGHPPKPDEWGNLELHYCIDCA